MQRLLPLLIAILSFITVSAQVEHTIVLDQSSFRAVHTDALTGANIDPIAKDKSRDACARVKIRFANMSRTEIEALEVKFRSNTDIVRQDVAQYFDNVLILEVTAKPSTRFYVQSPEFGLSNEVIINLEGDREYEMEARLNQTFSIVVNSDAKEAEVYIDNNFKGRIGSNSSLTISEVVIGPHTLKVVYGGISHEQNINVNKDSILFRQDVDTAAADPQYVVFEVEPKNAVVMINNQPYTLQEGAMMIVLPNGTYNYTVSAAGYHAMSDTFTVAGSKVEKRITLKADNTTVTLNAPNNAEIWINGSKRGVGVWSGILASGTYIFEARKDGHKSGKLTKTISSTPASQSYTLPAPTPITGALTITSIPLMAEVSLDGTPAGRTPLDLKNIITGSHTISISKAGYNTYTQTVVIAEGKTTTLNATLTKQTATTVTPTPTATSNIGEIEMVFVKGGTFTMGATAEQGSDAFDFEKPTHSVTVSDFYIGKYEVTQAQWRAVMGSNPSCFKGDNLPVEEVSWDDVQEFIKKLNAKTGKRFRLPTEAEWEYAARGGNQSKGYKFSGSNSISDVAWYDDNSRRKTHPVGQKRPNELGIYDMSGNVFEWCQDWYSISAYTSSSQTNPTGPSGGSLRVLRGGSWYLSARGCRVSYRNNSNPDYRSSDYGFRLALSADNKTSSNTSTATAAPSKVYKIGDYYNENGKEGVVFEVTPDGKHGKIVSLKVADNLYWTTDSYEQKRLIGADSKSDGEYNMAKVKSIAGWQTKYPAFKWCADLGSGWYLPAIEELKRFTLNATVREAVNRTLTMIGYKAINNKSNYYKYFSSTELDYKWYSGEYSVHTVLTNCSQAASNSKQTADYVRAVATF